MFYGCALLLECIHTEQCYTHVTVQSGKKKKNQAKNLHWLTLSHLKIFHNTKNNNAVRFLCLNVLPNVFWSIKIDTRCLLLLLLYISPTVLRRQWNSALLHYIWMCTGLILQIYETSTDITLFHMKNKMTPSKALLSWDPMTYLIQTLQTHTAKCNESTQPVD